MFPGLRQKFPEMPRTPISSLKNTTQLFNWDTPTGCPRFRLVHMRVAEAQATHGMKLTRETQMPTSGKMLMTLTGNPHRAITVAFPKIVN